MRAIFLFLIAILTLISAQDSVVLDDYDDNSEPTDTITFSRSVNGAAPSATLGQSVSKAPIGLPAEVSRPVASTPAPAISIISPAKPPPGSYIGPSAIASTILEKPTAITGTFTIRKSSAAAPSIPAMLSSIRNIFHSSVSAPKTTPRPWYTPLPSITSSIFTPSDATIMTRRFRSGHHNSAATEISMPPVRSVTPIVTPTPSPDSTLGRIFACIDVAFVNCQYFTESMNDCHEFKDDYFGSISAFRPDKGQVCYLYTESKCGGDFDSLVFPGSSNMRGRRFDNRAKSWKCILPK